MASPGRGSGGGAGGEGMTDAEYRANRERLRTMRTTRGSSRGAINRLASALDREANRRNGG